MTDTEIAKLRKALRNRVVGFELEASVEELLANPFNFRGHPMKQQHALAGSIDDIGFIDPVLVNVATGHVIDGHLRVSLALRSGVDTLPVLFVDLTEDEEKKALLLLDPIAALAKNEDEKLVDLLGMVNSDDDRVQQMLADLADKEGLFTEDKLPEPGDAESEDTGEAWGVIVYCDDEAQQVALLEQMLTEGYRCKALL